MVFKPGSANDSSRHIIMQQVTLTDIHHHHGNSANQWGSVWNSPSVYIARTCTRGWAVPPVRRTKRETQTRGGQTELWFPLQVCESQTRGREGPKKRLFQDGCYRNVISRKGVADACRDVSMAVPCMCGDKYHMTQSTLCTNELCSALLGKVYDSLVFCFFVFFLKQPWNRSACAGIV